LILADATTATAPAAAIATTTADIAAAFCLIVVCPHHYLCLRRLCLPPLNLPLTMTIVIAAAFWLIVA
jgi:hypothetical protein